MRQTLVLGHAMKVFELRPRRMAPLVLLCGFVCLGSPSLHAQDFVFADFSSTNGLKLNDKAAAPVTKASGAHVLQIIPILTYEVGSAWYSTSFPLSRAGSRGRSR
jgi:hypothetical protein